ncbi:MAG TPA: GldG family protein, partial [Roseimicrobium sp.]|nr:GldG family protein [Roseimicrobium sp.]
HVSLSVIALLAVVAMVNFISIRHPYRKYLQGAATQPLSPLTQQLLLGMTNEVKVVVFYDPKEQLFNSVKSLLEEYRQISPRISLEVVDYITNPSRAIELREKYRLASLSDRNVVIFDCEGRTKIVSDGMLSEYDIQAVMTGKDKEFRRTAFRGEMLYTSAIITVSESRTQHVYFLTGHGEHDPSDLKSETGFAKFAAMLQDNNLQLRMVNLLQTNTVPADCDLLVIAGPLSPLDPGEVQRVESYLNQGGRMLLLLNYLSRAGMDRLLSKWDVRIGDDRVRDPQNTMAGNDVIIREFGQHPVVKSFSQSGLPLHMAAPRSITSLQNGKPSADSAQVVELAKTGPEGVAHEDIRQGVAYPNARDRKGAIPVIAAVEKGTVKGIKVDKGSTRIVVAGDSLFLNNKMIESAANRDFGWQSTQWLLDRSYLVGNIGPKAVSEFKVMITRSQMTTLRWLLLLGLPGGVMLFGALVWWRRRS